MEYFYTKDNDYFDKCYNFFEGYGITISQVLHYSDLLSKIKSNDYSTIFIDYDYAPFEIEILADLITSGFMENGKTVIITDSEKIINYLKSIGIKYLSRKNCFNNFELFISSLKIKNNIKINMLKNDFKEKIYNKMLDLGLIAKYSGFNYLYQIALLVFEDNSLLNSLMKDCYEVIALKYDTSPSCIERAIRNVKCASKIEMTNKSIISKIIS